MWIADLEPPASDHAHRSDTRSPLARRANAADARAISSSAGGVDEEGDDKQLLLDTDAYAIARKRSGLGERAWALGVRARSCLSLRCAVVSVLACMSLLLVVLCAVAYTVCLAPSPGLSMSLLSRTGLVCRSELQQLASTMPHPGTPPASDMIHVSQLPAYFHPELERTLVLYVFAANDPVYLDNLRFFVSSAVRANDPADYVFIIQQDAADAGKRTPLSSLPSLPPNARYVEHDNECLDWGTYAWLLSLPTDDPRAVRDQQRYQYFILMNSSVRGPFVPAWADYVMPFDSPLFSWTSIFTQPLRAYGAAGLHYVGVSIQCPLEWPWVTHVQSYVVATDVEGLSVLRRSSAWKCHASFERAVNDGEIGASQAMLRAGFNIGSIAAFAHLLDYRDAAAQAAHCRRHSDVLTRGVDGMQLDPLDLVFTKYRTSMRAYDSTFAFQRAQIYDRWWRDREYRRSQAMQNHTFATQ